MSAIMIIYCERIAVATKKSPAFNVWWCTNPPKSLVFYCSQPQATVVGTHVFLCLSEGRKCGGNEGISPQGA